MADNYICLAQAIVIDSTNNQLKVTIGGTAETLTVASGTYYLAGSFTETSNILKALKDCIETHSSSPTVTLTSLTAFNINGTAQQTCTWAFTVDVATTIDWSAGSTFPYLYIGAPTSSTGTSHASTQDPIGWWVSDQPPSDESKNQTARDVTQNLAMDGNTFTFKRGKLSGTYSFDFEFINPERVLMSEANALATQAKFRTLESFIEYASGNGVRVMKLADTATPGTLSGLDDSTKIIDSNTFVSSAVAYFFDFILDESTLADFNPARFSAGLELYSFPIVLRPKVV